MRRRRGVRREGIVGVVPPPPPDAAAALARIAEELASLKQGVDALALRFERLAGENAELRARLEQSESAREDLLAQAEHVVELLGDSRRQLRAAWQQPGTAPGR